MRRWRVVSLILAPLTATAVMTGCGDAIGPTTRAPASIVLAVDGFTDQVVIDSGALVPFTAVALNESGLPVDAGIIVASSDPSILAVEGNAVAALRVGTAVMRAATLTQFAAVSDSIVVVVRRRLIGSG
jgi:hypothetical protein